MKISFSRLAGALLLVLALASSSQAVPIYGEISIDGKATLVGSNLGSSTGANAVLLTDSPGATVTASTGAFAGTNGTQVAYSAFNWAPPSGAITPLWTFTTGGSTYSFDLASLTVVTHTSTFLNLVGSGTLSISSSIYDPTAGSWSYTALDDGDGVRTTFGFLSTTVPDGGSTALLLGAALLGFGFFRRRKISA